MLKGITATSADGDGRKTPGEGSDHGGDPGEGSDHGGDVDVKHEPLEPDADDWVSLILCQVSFIS